MNQNGIQQTSPLVNQQFGSRYDLEALINRLTYIYKIPAHLAQDENNRGTLIRAAQLCISFNYLPGLHVCLLPFGTEYVEYVTYETWKQSSDWHARTGGFTYFIETQPMPQDEVECIRGDRYMPDDRGCYARVLHSGHAQLYTAMNRDYEPAWVTGLYRVKGQWSKSKREWIADTIPAHRTAEDVAKRRAKKQALMEVFSLVPLNPQVLELGLEQLNGHLDQHQKDTAPIAKPDIEYTQEGDVLFMT